MSYILEALKKSDQQRQRGATPTLPSAQVTVDAPKQPFPIYYGLLAAALLCAGIVIGWLRPWQEAQSAHTADPNTARTSISNSVAPAPLSEPPETIVTEAQKLPVANSTPAMQAPKIDAMQPVISASASPRVTDTPVSAPSLMPKNPANPADAAKEQKAIPMAELPLAIQQELPPMAIHLHSYSSKSANSLVSINSRLLKEGESLAPGLTLEQITPDGVIFSYKKQDVSVRFSVKTFP